jgi:hypothetical protein
MTVLLFRHNASGYDSCVDECNGDYVSTENERHLLDSYHTSEKWRSIERYAQA